MSPRFTCAKMMPATGMTDDDAVEEAEAALSNADSEFGRTTDPVRMYMREMGQVELLTSTSVIHTLLSI